MLSKLHILQRHFATLRNLFVLIGLLISGTAFAQTSGLTGTVTDATGAAVSNATVSVRNVETGVTRVLTTNDKGYYSVTAIQPGSYTVTVNATGFATIVRSGIVLALDTSSSADLTLKNGGATTEVTVNADASLLQSDSPEFESHVTSQQFDELPLVQYDRMRNPASFVYLTPGVQGNINTNGSEYTGATNVIIANGSQQYTTELLLEGLPGGQSRVPGNYTESAPSVDAVGEFKMTTTLLSSEYGHTGAAVGSFRVKSGTNQWHGSLYEYIRNTAFDANFWLAKHVTGTPLKLSKKQNEFGATLGGPIVIPGLYNGHNKSFFFFAYGGSRLAGGASTVSTVVVPTARQRVGDFSQTCSSATATPPNCALISIYDPATTTTAANGNVVRTQFPGNVIPQSRIDPVAQKIIDLMPLANAGELPSGQGGTYSGFTGASKLTPDVYTGKIDHNLSASQVLSAVYVRTIIPRTTISSPLPKPLGGNTYQVVAAHTIRLNHNWTISPKLLNSIFLGFNRFTNTNLPLYQDANYPEAIGLTGIPDASYFPNITFSTNSYGAISTTTNANVPENDYYIKDRISWSWGKHFIKAGGEYRIVQFNDRNPYKLHSQLVFHSQSTATQPSSGTGVTYSGGSSFASLFLGQTFQYSVLGSSQFYTRKRYTGFFVQDDVRFNDRLTLNLGLRYEYQNSPREKYNAHSAIDLNGPNPGAGNLPGVLAFASANRPTFFAADYSAISPRFGFAFRANNTLVLRGGYGMFYTESVPNTALSRSGYTVTSTYETSAATPALVLKNGIPDTYASTATLSPTALNGTTGSYWDKNAGKMPRIQEWSLSLQQGLGKQASLEFIYIGTHGTGLVDSQMSNINQLDPKYWSLGSVLQANVGSAAANAAGVVAPYPGFKGTVAQALRPYPQYSTLTSLAGKDGYNIYHAGQVVYHQRTGFGLTFYGGYVWSKNVGVSSPSFDGQSITDNVLQNAYDPGAERSLLPQDVPHSVIFNYQYALPLGKGHRFLRGGVGNAFAGGWKVTGIQRYQSGAPLMLITGNNTSTTLFNRITRPNVVAGASRGRQHTGSYNYDDPSDKVINPAAFTAPTGFNLGNAKPNYGDVRNFASFTEDLAVLKETKLSEKVQWSFYAQSTNIFNRHRFYGIGTSVSSTAAFGKPTNASSPRFLQFGTRFRF